MTLQELKAMNLALEALMYASYEDIEYNDACAAKVLEARNALKEALAQPEQEPLIGCVNHDCDKCKERTWVGLTDEEIEDAIDDGFAFGLDDGNVSNQMVIRYVRVIEAKLRSKN